MGGPKRLAHTCTTHRRAERVARIPRPHLHPELVFLTPPVVGGCSDSCKWLVHTPLPAKRNPFHSLSLCRAVKLHRLNKYILESETTSLSYDSITTESPNERNVTLLKLRKGGSFEICYHSEKPKT